MKNRLILVVGGLVILLLLLYKDSSKSESGPMGTSWDNPPKSEAQKRSDEKIKNGFRTYNKGYNNLSSDGYETIEIIREKKVGPKTYLDIKHKRSHKIEIDYSDPYVQDIIEDETRR